MNEVEDKSRGQEKWEQDLLRKRREQETAEVYDDYDDDDGDDNYNRRKIVIGF